MMNPCEHMDGLDMDLAHAAEEIESLRQQLTAIPDIRVQEAALVGENMILKNQLAECERERDELRKRPRIDEPMLKGATDTAVIIINELREQLASVTKDAERYRWLRENSNKISYCLLCGYDGLDCWEADDLDLQIDGLCTGGVTMIEKLKWNDATKKLPDDAGTVLLWVRTAKPFSNPVWMTGYFDDGDWRGSETGNVVHGIVTHWAEPNGPGA